MIPKHEADQKVVEARPLMILCVRQPSMLGWLYFEDLFLTFLDRTSTDNNIDVRHAQRHIILWKCLEVKTFIRYFRVFRVFTIRFSVTQTGIHFYGRNYKFAKFARS
jgi:hypothetical protein